MTSPDAAAIEAAWQAFTAQVDAQVSAAVGAPPPRPAPPAPVPPTAPHTLAAAGLASAAADHAVATAEAAFARHVAAPTWEGLASVDALPPAAAALRAVEHIVAAAAAALAAGCAAAGVHPPPPAVTGAARSARTGAVARFSAAAPGGAAAGLAPVLEAFYTERLADVATAVRRAGLLPGGCWSEDEGEEAADVGAPPPPPPPPPPPQPSQDDENLGAAGVAVASTSTPAPLGGGGPAAAAATARPPLQERGFLAAGGGWSPARPPFKAADDAPHPARRRRKAPPPLCAATLLGPAWAARVRGVSAAAAALGGGPRAVEAALSAASRAAIAAAAAKAAERAGFEAPILEAVCEFAATVPPVLIAVGAGSRAAPPPPTATASAAPPPPSIPAWWLPHLDAFAHDAVGTTRIDALFDIVVDYPASQPALTDVAACLAHGGVLGGEAGSTSRRAAADAARHPAAPLRRRLATSLGVATRARLLHAGAATADIIAQYVATVRALRAVLAGEASGCGRAALQSPDAAAAAAAAAGGTMATLLAEVGAPVQAYLRARRDTVRCVVGVLTGGGDAGGGGGGEAGDGACAGPSLLDELAAEAAAGDGSGGGNTMLAVVDSDSDGGDGADEPGRFASAGRWAPAPAAGRRGRGGAASHRPPRTGLSGAFPPPPSGRAGPALDAAALLVAIFGAPGALVDEYRAALAGRLLARGRGAGAPEALDAEHRTLELLRLRFGEGAPGLAPADVMLRDVADARRLDGALAALAPSAVVAAASAIARADQQHQPGGGPGPAVILSPAARAAAAATATTDVSRVSALVASSLYWPPTCAAGASPTASAAPPPCAPPAPVDAWLAAYAARYAALKAPRRLVWRPGAGCVSVRVTVGGEVMEATVPPLEASVVAAVAASPASSVSGADLAASVRCPDVSAVTAAARAWVGRGVLVEERGGTGGFGRSTRLGGGGGGGGGGRGPTIQDDDAPASAAEAAASAGAALIESFVLGMLTNFAAGLPLERMHGMLKLFAVDPPYDGSPADLAALLDRLVREEKVRVEGGVYRKA